MAHPDVPRIRAAIATPSFTPGKRDLAALLAVLVEPAASDATVTLASKALLRAEAVPATAATLAALDAALAAAPPDDAAAARLVAALGVLARAAVKIGADDDAPPAAARLIALATDPPAAAPRAARGAIVALGKLGGDGARAALCAVWDRAALPSDQRRAVTEALGKVGGPEARARLDDAPADALDADPELRRRRDRALLMSERDAGREAPSHVRGEVAPPEEIVVVARCRSGLEDLLAAELGAPATSISACAVRRRSRVPLATFFAGRTWITLGIELPLVSRAHADLSDRIAATLAAPATRALLAALTDGPIRWRLQLAGAGHQRAVVWRTAQAVRAAAPELINDPTATTWDVVVDAGADSLELRPRRLDDPRFAWRVADVPAASHPTIAAALARVAGVRPDDIVWDPFCGSGAELIERARLGPFRQLIGTDLDPRALDAARANLDAAGLTAACTLLQADALAHTPDGVTLIISNPPLGRRIRGDAPALLEHFAEHAARVLVPGGRLVWITPAPHRTERAARYAGLQRVARRSVDLGGYTADLEHWQKSAGVAAGTRGAAS